MFHCIPRSNVSLSILTLATLLTVLPACSATAQHGAVRQDCPPDSQVSRNTVFRPILSRLPSRTFYVSGYAGASYPPLGQGAMIDRPTSRTARRPIFSGWLRGR